MVSRSNQVQLTDELARFKEGVRVVAVDLVRTIFRRELLNRLDELKRGLLAPKAS